MNIAHAISSLLQLWSFNDAQCKKQFAKEVSIK
jgi:hypothetical protein